MSEIKNTIWNKRMPSFLGIFFLLIAVGTITWLSRNTILFGTKAALSTEPRDVNISNVSDTSFTVSYVTDGPTFGTVNFGTNGKTDQIMLDDRDQIANKPQAHAVHFITITKLTPQTKYSFSITSGDKVYLNNNAPYEITTANPISSTPAANNPLIGKITLDDGSTPLEALVYVSSDNSQPLASLINPDGSYKITLTNLRDNNLTAFINLNENDILNLTLEDSTRKSQVSLLANQTNPVPVIILSKDYDFSVSDQPLASSASASANLSGTPAALPTTGGKTITSPQIITPQKNQAFKDQQPLFKGKAIPNTNVTITINSVQTITSSVATDANGNWQYRPDAPLDPGTHTITMSTIDASGLVKTISQSFTVYAAGSQFTEPSVSPMPTVTPTNAPTVAPTVKPTGTGTPTPTTTTTPTATITKAPNISLTKPPVPVTGSNNSLILSVVGGISAVGIGALLFFLTAL